MFAENRWLHWEPQVREPSVGIILFVISITWPMAGCARRVGPNSNTVDALRSYEAWLAQSRTPQHGVGAPKSPWDIVFDADMRAAPEQGFSKVHLKENPERAFYIYGGDVDRLISPVFVDGLALVGVPVGKWAYINRAGRFVFAPIFRAANPFDDGVATAQFGPSTSVLTKLPDSAWVLLTTSGVMRVLDNSIVAVEPFSAGFAAFSSIDHRHGYIDQNGRITIGATYTFARPFCADGTAAVEVGSTWGVIDSHGRLIIPAEYEDVRCFSEGLAAAKRGKWGFIDKTNIFVVPPQLDGIGDFSGGLASFESRSWPNGQTFPYVSMYGFIDGKGTVAVPPIYSAINPFHFGIARVGTTRINWIVYPLSYFVPADPHYTSWKYIDQHGNTIASGTPE